MTGRVLILALVGLVHLGGIGGSLAAQEGEDVAFEGGVWRMLDGRLSERTGRPCIAGTALLTGVQFENGSIEVELFVDGSRSYPGVVFRRRENDYERFYIRPHRAGLYPDALQYTPVFNGVAGWQLYSGKGYTAAAEIPAGEWFRIRIEAAASQARVYLGDAPQPALEIPRLEHGTSRGEIGVMAPTDGTACLAGFRYSTDPGPEVSAVPSVERPAGSLMEWQISKAFKADQIDPATYPHFYTIFHAGWESVRADPTGLVDVARYRERTAGGADAVLARAILRSDTRQRVALHFGYSDRVDLFLNGRRLFAGNSAYRSRDPSFVGVVGLHDMVDLELERGLNEIFLVVSEAFGGWGFRARTEPVLEAPRIEHRRLQKLWETPANFLTPESVVFDPDRRTLYVSSFDAQYRTREAPLGKISKLTLDGRIEELDWVTGLHGPTGMVLQDGDLWVLERTTLTRIALPGGTILARHPIPGADFPNDVTADGDGALYISDTSPKDHRASRIYRFREGEMEVWLDGEEIVRANGVFVHEGVLLVGNSGDGSLKAVDLETRSVRKITTLGAGIVDGIRIDRRGGYLLSHWEGQIYRVDSEGRVTEIADTLLAGVNAADFELVLDEDLLLVPTFLDNRVVAYRLHPD